MRRIKLERRAFVYYQSFIDVDETLDEEAQDERVEQAILSGEVELNVDGDESGPALDFHKWDGDWVRVP